MSSYRAWARHFQSGWENHAADPELPLWIRIVSIAYGRHAANGHAMFQRGDLSRILGTAASGDQPFKPRHRDSIRDAIRVAIKHKFLADGSCSECLVVPSHDIAGGLGNESKPCPVHERKRALKQAKARLSLVS